MSVLSPCFEKRRLLVKKIVLLFVFAFLLSPFKAFSGGSGVYPNGAEGFMVAVVPGPGNYIMNYMAYMYLHDLKDNHGHDVDAFKHGFVFAEVLRGIHITKKKILGGYYGLQLFIPVLKKKLNFDTRLGPDSRSHYNDFKIPYLIFSGSVWTRNLSLWKGKMFMVISLPDIYIPLYNDDNSNLANLGINYWTFEPVFCFSYLTKRWEFSMKFMYDWSTKQNNSPTPYGLKLDREPGQEFHFDYNMSYAVTPKLRIGVGGFYYTQISNDNYDIPEHTPLILKKQLHHDEGARSKAFAIGPGICYAIKKNLIVTLRYQQTVYERSFPEMRNIWLKLIWAIGK